MTHLFVVRHTLSQSWWQFNHLCVRDLYIVVKELSSHDLLSANCHPCLLVLILLFLLLLHNPLICLGTVWLSTAAAAEGNSEQDHRQEEEDGHTTQSHEDYGDRLA